MSFDKNAIDKALDRVREAIRDIKREKSRFEAEGVGEFANHLCGLEWINQDGSELHPLGE